MSLAFQKLNGNGTAAQAQLDVQKAILEELKHPDLWRMAHMFEPTANLIPITKTWLLDLSAGANDSLQFNGRYFGKWTINYISIRVAIGNGSVRRSIGRLYDGENVVALTGTTIHGNDQAQWNADHAEHYGYGTSMGLEAVASDDPWHSLHVQFIGFKVPDTTIVLPPVTHDILFNYPVGVGNIKFYAGDKSDKEVIGNGAPGSTFPKLPEYFLPTVYFKNLGDNYNLRIQTVNMVKTITPGQEVILESLFLQDAKYSFVIQKLSTRQNFRFINNVVADQPLRLIVEGSTNANNDYIIPGLKTLGVFNEYPRTYTIVNTGISDIELTINGTKYLPIKGQNFQLPDFSGIDTDIYITLPPKYQRFNFVNSSPVERFKFKFKNGSVSKDFNISPNSTDFYSTPFGAVFSIVNTDVELFNFNIDGVDHALQIGEEYMIPEYYGVEKTINLIKNRSQS